MIKPILTDMMVDVDPKLVDYRPLGGRGSRAVIKAEVLEWFDENDIVYTVVRTSIGEMKLLFLCNLDMIAFRMRW